MPPMKSISRPGNDHTLSNAIQAIRPPYEDLVSLADVSIQAAAGSQMPEEFVDLARRAESVGWTFEIAQDAIRELAREQLRTQGASAN